MVMQQYDSYKPSGVEWIGQIPSHWKVRRLKHLFIGNTGVNITKSDLEDEGYPVISYGQIHSKDNPGTSIVDDLIRYIPKDKIQNKAKAEYGDFIFADTSEDLEGCGNCVWIDRDTPLYAGYHTILLKSVEPIKSSYLAYLFRSDEWRGQIRSRVYGVKVYSITQTILSLTSTLFPPLEEQERIAEYLDKRCAEIDGIINKEEQAIALLDELKQTIISEAVTYGLDPAVPLKPSGVDWIGQTPNHWEVRRLKYVVSCNDEVLSEMTPPSSVINYVEISDVTYINGIKGSTEYEFKDAPSRARRITRVNDVIISTVRTYLKAITRVNEPDVIVSTGFAVLRAQSIDDLYLSYVVNSSGFIDDVVANSFGVTYPSITASKLISLSVPLPPLEEQERIAEYLDRRCAEIDEAKERKQRQIELLREMKQTMISDAVTGRVKVF